MVKIFNKQTNAFVGEINDEEFQYLADHLEEEGLDDTDYFLMRDTVEQFEADGASPKLVQLLKTALGPNDSVEIRWSDE